MIKSKSFPPPENTTHIYLKIFPLRKLIFINKSIQKREELVKIMSFSLILI